MNIRIHKEDITLPNKEAAGPHRDMMKSLLSKMREKQTYIENAKKLIDKRNNEINHKEELIINEVGRVVQNAGGGGVYWKWMSGSVVVGGVY